MPTFRPDVLETAFHFTFADKLAPRLGAAYDVWGDGRMKVFGSWGLYYDWTKYELPRGSFGAETWCIYYRGLDTLDLGSLSLTQHAGPRPVGHPGQLPRPARAVVRQRHRSRARADAAVEHERAAPSTSSPTTASSRSTTSTTTCSRRSRTSAS